MATVNHIFIEVFQAFKFHELSLYQKNFFKYKYLEKFYLYRYDKMACPKVSDNLLMHLHFFLPQHYKKTGELKIPFKGTYYSVEVVFNW